MNSATWRFLEGLAVAAKLSGACAHKITIGDSDLINVRFGPLCGLKSDILRGPRSANSGCEQSQQKKTTRSPRRRRQAAQVARSGRAHARRLVVKLAAETPEMGKFPVNFPVIPALRDDPKLVGRDDTKVVGDSVAKAVPFFGNSSPEEAQDCRSELREGFIASVIGDMFVHYARASFDRIKMRTIGRDEVQPDPASRLPQPLTH